jgi:hypothetical protein
MKKLLKRDNFMKPHKETFINNFFEKSKIALEDAKNN